jgi:hypothetical protein
MPIHSMCRCLNTFILQIWMSDAVSGGLHDITAHLGSTLTQFFKIWPPPAQVYQCKGAPICPSTAYYGAQVLYIYTDICYMTNPLLRYILFFSRTGSVTSEAKSVTSPGTNTKKTLTWGISRQGSGHFF